MKKLILGYPYSGALYAYIADQRMGNYSHTRAVGRHPYYTTLYGRKYQRYTERALMFTLTYDEIFVTPADNPWPKSRTSESLSFHPELGLHSDWDAYKPLFNDVGGVVARYLSDRQIRALLGQAFKIPRANWQMVMSSILFEYCLSRQHRCEILCSPGRKAILDRLVQIDQPALYPYAVGTAKIDAIDHYMDATSLLLSPNDLDDLSNMKSDRNVRAYATGFLRCLDGFSEASSDDTKRRLLSLAREAIETESIARSASGMMKWTGKLFKMLGLPHLSVATLGGEFFSKHVEEQARWYSFAGEIQKAASKSALIRNLDQQLDGLRRQ
jgi:hypothetical protein